MSGRVSDAYTGKAQFQDMLDRAANNAKNAWETEFVENLQEKFNAFGIEMFLSDRQNEILERIASGENE